MKPITIKEEQEIQIDILKFLAEICKQENIDYYLAYGTLLGAVRNGKFIEWDDDIDVWMKREDCERLSLIFSKYNCEDKYFLQSSFSEKHMPVPGMYRICANGTYKWHNLKLMNRFNTGIYFDIFPLDFACKNKREEKIRSKICSISNNLLYAKLHRKSGNHNIKVLLVQILSKLIPYEPLSKITNNIYKTKNPDKNRLICYPSSTIYPNNVFNADEYEKVIVEFEGMKCTCPKGYDHILTARYGDWRIPSNTKSEYDTAYII